MEAEGLFFYFLSWISWIVVVFFFRETRHRFLLSALILALMAGSSTYFPIYRFQVNLAYIFFMISALILLGKTLKKQYLLNYFSICTVTLAYVCFKLFEIYDPVWIIFDRKWMLAFILLYLALLLFKSREERYVFLLVGVLQGELLTGFILNHVFSYSVIGSFEFLDVVSLTMAGLSSWIVFETITVYLDGLIQKRVKEKQG